MCALRLDVSTALNMTIWSIPNIPCHSERSEKSSVAQKKKIMWVYILTNHTNSVLYIGVTNDIIRRTEEHKYQYVSGFAEKYHTYKLVYVEETDNPQNAIAREKQLKGWTRAKKNALIETLNPQWKDLLKD